MSAYSDWKCGGITDEEYASACRREEEIDRAIEEEKEAEENDD